MPRKAGITTLKSDSAFGRFKGKVYTQANYIASPARAYPGFYHMRQLGVLPLPPGFPSQIMQDNPPPTCISLGFPENLPVPIYTP